MDGFLGQPHALREDALNPNLIHLEVWLQLEMMLTHVLMNTMTSGELSSDKRASSCWQANSASQPIDRLATVRTRGQLLGEFLPQDMCRLWSIDY